MYPVFRLWNVMRRARSRPPLGLFDESRIELICWPIDIDMFLEMNNGRVSTIFDLGRFDLAVRTGLIDAMKRRNWALAVAGSSLRFRNRVHMFERVRIHTRLLGFEGRWGYIAQSMWKGETPASSILLRTAVTDANGAVDTSEVMRELGHETDSPGLPDWALAWIEADAMRPWPPVRLQEPQAGPSTPST